MPTKTKTPAAKPATTQEKPAAAPNAREHNPERYAAFVDAVRAEANDRLERYMKAFIQDGLPEEKQFMNDVFMDWEGGYVTGVKGHGEHEVPLFSAIQSKLDGMHLVPVESMAMVAEVNQFITDKIASGWQREKPNTQYWQESEEQIRKRLTALLNRQVQYFFLRCKRTDLIFMIDILEQWEMLTDNAEFWDKTKYPLAAAAELHLDVMKRRRES